MNRYHACLAVGLASLLLATTSNAAVVVTTAPLAGANENPANGSPATGQAGVTIDTTAHTLRVIVSFSGLVAPSTLAHVHCCTTPPNNAGVATAMPAFPGFPLGVTAGQMDMTYDTTQASTWNAAFVTANGGTAGAEAVLAAGLANGQAYLNIHTSTYPAGEIRGFLQPQVAASGAIIPTLSQWALIGLVIVLAGASWMMLRRRRQ